MLLVPLQRRETKSNTDYFPVAQLNLLINQTLNIPRSSSIKVVKNLRKVESIQIKHSRGICPKQFIQRVTGIQGVVIMWLCVCVCELEKSVCESEKLLQRTDRGGKRYRLCKASGLCERNCERSADKSDMLFLFMFTVAGILQLITVRRDISLLPALRCTRAISYKRWFYNQLVFILPGSRGVSGWAQGTPLHTNEPKSNQKCSDKCCFMSMKSLQLTVINCYQETIPHNRDCIWIKRKSREVAGLTVRSCISNILHEFPPVSELQTKLVKQITFLRDLWCRNDVLSRRASWFSLTRCFMYRLQLNLYQG